MDIRCPECDTLYEIDTRQLRGSASTLKCSQCEHIFHMQTHAALHQETQRRWMLRSHTSGDIRYFLGFNELHHWILQGVVSKPDEISRTGRGWKALGSIGEFMPIFQAVESVANISAPREKQVSAELPDSGPTAEFTSTRAPRPNSADVPRDFASQPRVPTARQHGLPPARPQSGTHNAASRQPSGPNPARSQTPFASKAMPPEAPRRPAHTPTQTPPPAPPSRVYGAGVPEPVVDPEDNWSLGELPGTLAEEREFEPPGREVSGSFALQSTTREPSAQHPSIVHAAGDSTPSRSKTPIIIAATVVLGAGLSLFLLKPPFVQELLGANASPSVQADAAAQASAPEAAAAGEDEQALAAQKAEQEALAAEHEKLTSAIAAAHPHINSALAKADKDAEAAVPEKPRELSVTELLESARKALDAGKSEQARKQYHKVLSRDRSNSSAITGLGWSLIALNRPPAAAAQFQKAISLNPSYGDAYIGLGKAKRDMGDHQGALNAYQDYLKRFPSGSKASIARHQADKLKLALGQ
ncbi:zinc-ribbon domain-containing protein [Bradymonas sediminis]|nr:zinc-ribbon domain-containing protein [Bradymonas sediminis]TDP72036.1 putative Zn finger-like uncharacterized protein [Bradymonas sediminis]